MTSLFAYLSYRDAPAAIEWLEAIGFRVVTRQPGADGMVLHAEVRLGDVVVMLATADADYRAPTLVGRSTGSGLYLLVDDVDAIYGAAIEAGATEVFEPETTGWAPCEPASSTPRATSGHSATTSPAAVGEAPSGRPLGPESTTRSRSSATCAARSVRGVRMGN
jgi:uncharacterized glyoxalase superfamily protein PhnB